MARLEEASSRSVAAMGVMLAAMKRSDEAEFADFDACWSNAIQRLRVQPYMDDDEAAELLEDKEILASTKPAFRAAFNGEPTPILGGTRRNGSADSAIADH